jgi:starch phosphorylase
MITEIRTRPAPELEVPEVFSRLLDIVYNLWWSWSPRAHALYDRLSPPIWRHYRNPIDVLIDLGPERWSALLEDGDLASSYHALVADFDAYMRPNEPTWFQREHEGYEGGPFAYFSMEYGWHECLQIYSGGLGVLSGDHCKSASDLGLPFVGIGLMYKHGYFRQTIDSEGFQQHFYPDYDLNRLPLRPVIDASNREIHVPVELRDRTVYLRVWKASIGRVPVLLLDSDIPINHAADRAITSTLYVRGREMRLCQEILLGLGGTRVLAELGIQPAAWHMNEGHSALLVLARLRALGAETAGLGKTLEKIASQTIFTTHTPVPAGNETFDTGLVKSYFDDWLTQAGLEPDPVLDLGRHGDDSSGESFNLTALALRASGRANAVSELHGEVSNGMWRSLLESSHRSKIESVTNGVHASSWIGPEISALLSQDLGAAQGERALEPDFGEAVAAIPDHELWTAHRAQKKRLITLVRERTLDKFARQGRSPERLRQVDELLDPEVLTIGFARRFATYKRADLLLRDMHRLEELAGNADRPVQFIFAGKAHPIDRPGQDLIRRICDAARSPGLRARIVFVENYDMRIARHLVQGVDLWLGASRRPHEASGTSGMKAAMNGVLNCSILDGWWCEGYDPLHGWAFGNPDFEGDEAAQDQVDADSLYHTLFTDVVPCYYDINENGLPTAWIQRMKHAISLLMPRFCTARMVREYADRFYVPSSRGELVQQPAPTQTP